MSVQATLLLTPGPLTTADTTRAAMARDWGSREPDFIALTRRLREQLLVVADAPAGYTAVPLQGSGTFAVEATLATLIGPDDRLLVMSNGPYAQRVAAIATRMGHAVHVLESDERDTLDTAALDAALAADGGITHVAVVHGETSSGRTNPLEEIARIVAAHGRALLIDAMSTFGALPIVLADSPIAAVVASCNKCLEGVPGVAFAIVRTADLEHRAGNSRSTSLDLHAQWRGFEDNGQWRFTPPVQIVAAAVEALRLHAVEGGVVARHARYAARARRLVEAMSALGIEALLPAEARGPCIVAFRLPDTLAPVFRIVTESLREAGIAIYPGKLTVAETFRIGCMGVFDDATWQRFFDRFAEGLARAGWSPGAGSTPISTPTSTSASPPASTAIVEAQA